MIQDFTIKPMTWVQPSPLKEGSEKGEKENKKVLKYNPVTLTKPPQNSQLHSYGGANMTASDGLIHLTGTQSIRLVLSLKIFLSVQR